jgi:outer membrane protein assembly factor BamA
MGLNLVWDSRDNILNSLTGSYVYYSALFFGGYLGSDYNYITTMLDARKYFNPALNHTIALRGVLNFRYTDDISLPLRGLSRVGGGKFIRGYFGGTDQDNNMVAFETEYRLPFWNEDNIAPFRKFWKRMGVVVFLSGAQVFGERGSFGIDQFNLAAGGGLRILFSEESKVNLRIDYSLGLAADSNGPGKRQTGLYFLLAEAF